MVLENTVLIHGIEQHNGTIGYNQHEQQHHTELQQVIKQWKSIAQKEQFF